MRLGRADNEDGISGVSNDSFGNASQDPALDAGAPVGAHGDKVVRRLLRELDDFFAAVANVYK